MKYKLYECLWTSPLAWDNNPVGGYLQVWFHLTWIPFFSVKVPDKTFCSFNPFTALLNALQDESVASMKYTRLKDAVRNNGSWSKLK